MNFTKKKYEGFVETMVSEGLDKAAAENRAKRAMRTDKHSLREKDGASLDFIKSRDSKNYGVIVNHSSRMCQMEGCTGMRMHVRWDDGSTTYPCSKGCECVAPHLLKIM